MNSRRMKARSYLSQLAEPIPQGELALVAQPEMLARRGESGPQVPVIEDVVVSGEGQPERVERKSRRLHPAGQIAMASMERDQKAGERVVPESLAAKQAGEDAFSVSQVSSGQVPLSQVSSDGVVSGFASLGRGPSGSALEGSSIRAVPPAGVLASEARSREGDPGSATKGEWSATGRSRLVEARYEGSDDANRSSGMRPLSSDDAARGARSGAGNSGGKSASASGVFFASTAGAEESVASAFRQMPFGATVPRSVSAAIETGQSADQRKAENAVGNLAGNASRERQAANNPYGNDKRRSAGSAPRVVIGTVEIRTRMAQPAAAQVVQPQQIANRNQERFSSPGDARQGRQDSMARGLGWSYGLIQG